MANEQRPLRADAVRNRAKIVQAARAEIAERGIDVGMDEIARAAGVAVGTLYRHFPTKAALVAGIVSEYVEATAIDAEESLARVRARDTSALDEVAGFIERVGESASAHHVVKAAARNLGVDASHDSAAEARISAAFEEILRLGQASGAVRDGFTVSDLFLLLTTVPVDLPADARQRWVQLVLPGVAAGT